MKDYLRERVVIDAQHAIALAAQQSPLEHSGLKGRLRELVAQQLLRPWLPPYVGCGTGTIIHGLKDDFRKSTQDDIIVYDQTLMPSILIQESVAEGVFLNNSVLCRIEIKSRLNAKEISNFVEASKEFTTIAYVVPPQVQHETASRHFISRSCLLAFGSDLQPGTEFARFAKMLKQVQCSHECCSIICVVGNGLWMLRPHNDLRKWFRLRTADAAQQLACFVAVISNTIFQAHCERTVLGPSNSLAAGIGLYFPTQEEWEEQEMPS